MLAVTPFSVKREATKPNNNNIEAVREEKKDPEPSPGETEEQHSDDQKHKEKCNICQSKVGLSPLPQCSTLSLVELQRSLLLAGSLWHKGLPCTESSH